MINAYPMIQDYDNGLSLDMIAKKYDVTRVYVLQIIHSIKVERPRQILECRNLLEDLK